MILKLSSSGNDTSLMCRATVKVPFGAIGIQLLSINLPDNSGEFSPEFTGAILSNGFNVTVPAQGSLEDFVEYLNGIDTPNRTLFVYLHDNELEICSGEYAIVFSAAFANYLNLASVNLAANDCANVTIHREKMNPVSEYVVECGAPIQGVYDTKYTEVIGYVDGPKGKPEDFFFRFRPVFFFTFENTPKKIALRAKIPPKKSLVRREPVKYPRKKKVRVF